MNTNGINDLAKLLGMHVIVRMNPFFNSRTKVIDVHGSLIGLDPVTNSCMLLINHPESGGQSTTPAIATPDNVEANDPSEDGEISEHAPNSPTHRILIISGHSINRIEPNIYADDFNIVYTHDDIKRIVDQLLEQSVPLNTMSLEDARDSLITYFQSNHTIAIPSTKDQHTLLLHNEMVKILPPYLLDCVKSSDLQLKSQVSALVSAWHTSLKTPSCFF